MMRLRHDIPVLLLHNLNPEWSSAERVKAAAVVETLAVALRGLGHPVASVPVVDSDLAARLAPFPPRRWVVFNWCEELPGINHGDAAVVTLLEERGYAYTGATAEVLALSWRKATVKRLMENAGIPTPHWRLCENGFPESWSYFPAIVKPACEHCSFGITPDAVVLSQQLLAARIAWIRRTFGQAALIEEFIDGREFHVSLWGNERLEVLPVAEMDFSCFADLRERLCTYEAKFTPGSRHYEKIETLLPAPLAPAEAAALSDVCRRAYRAHGCRDYARMDVRLHNGIFYVLDVNPNPDFSPDASLVCAAETAGIPYGLMGSCLVNLAARRHSAFASELA